MHVSFSFSFASLEIDGLSNVINLTVLFCCYCGYLCSGLTHTKAKVLEDHTSSAELNVVYTTFVSNRRHFYNSRYMLWFKRSLFLPRSRVEHTSFLPELHESSFRLHAWQWCNGCGLCLSMQIVTPNLLMKSDTCDTIAIGFS
jgi:hypothetical protein